MMGVAYPVNEPFPKMVRKQWAVGPIGFEKALMADGMLIQALKILKPKKLLQTCHPFKGRPAGCDLRRKLRMVCILHMPPAGGHRQ